MNNHTHKFNFCDDLGTPELGIVMDHTWAQENAEEIKKTPGVIWFDNSRLGVNSGDMFLVPREEDRLYFILRWS